MKDKIILKLPIIFFEKGINIYCPICKELIKFKSNNSYFDNSYNYFPYGCDHVKWVDIDYYNGIELTFSLNE